MSADANKAIYRRYIDELWNHADFTSLGDLFSEGYVSHNAPPGIPKNREGYKPWISGFLAAFPDHVFTIEDMVAEGDKVVGRWSGRGTHQGPIFGIPATGRQMHWSGVDILHIVDGKITEIWNVEDLLGIMQQLRANPSS